MPRVTSFEIPKLGQDDIYSSADEASGILGLIRFIEPAATNWEWLWLCSLADPPKDGRRHRPMSMAPAPPRQPAAIMVFRTEYLGVGRYKWYYEYYYCNHQSTKTHWNPDEPNHNVYNHRSGISLIISNRPLALLLGYIRSTYNTMYDGVVDATWIQIGTNQRHRLHLFMCQILSAKLGVYSSSALSPSPIINTKYGV